MLLEKDGRRDMCFSPGTLIKHHVVPRTVLLAMLYDITDHRIEPDSFIMRLPAIFAILALLPALISGNCTPDNLIRGLERHGGIPYCVVLLSPGAMTTLALPSEVATTTYAPGILSSAVCDLLRILGAADG